MNRPHGAPAVADAALRACACLVTACLTVTAWHDVSKAWDTWLYHLPFAARLSGLVDRTSYAFTAANEARYEGFPVLIEWAQGLLWRLSGRVECANFVSLAAVGGVAIALRSWFSVPWHFTLLAMVAIPLVQTHAAACYIDLPANACAALFVVTTLKGLARQRAPSHLGLLGAMALAAAVANARFQLVPVVGVFGLLLTANALRQREGRLTRLLILVASAPVVFATLLRNLLLHGNPAWPMELPGFAFPFAEPAYASSPDWLSAAPRPMRFVASILEVGLDGLETHRRWSIDQWTEPTRPGLRLGGFFGAYVVVHLVALAAGWVRGYLHYVYGAGFMVLTVLVSLLPQSHELRYYMVWMITLVCLNLIVWVPRTPRSMGFLSVGALILVAWSTQGWYLVPRGEGAAAFVAAHTDAPALSALSRGARACAWQEPYRFLYAPVFHGRHDYAIREVDAPDECEKLFPLPHLP